MAKDERCKAEFIKLYGDIGEHYDEELWLERFGLWAAGWQGAVTQMLADSLRWMKPEMVEAFQRRITSWEV